MFKNEYSWGTAVKENTTDEFHQKFDTALNEVKNDLGKDYPIIINGISQKSMKLNRRLTPTLFLAGFPIAVKRKQNRQ